MVCPASAYRLTRQVSGSRRSEIELLLEPMLDAATRLRRTHPDLEFVIPQAGTLSEEQLLDPIRESGLEGEFPTNIRVDVTNQRGALAKLAAVIADQQANIVHVEMKDRDDRYTSLKFVVEVRNRQHLAHIMRRIHSLKHVSKISRR